MALLASRVKRNVAAVGLAHFTGADALGVRLAGLVPVLGVVVMVRSVTRRG